MIQFASTRVFTDDVDRLIRFYEEITGVPVNRLHPLFGELATTSGTLAIASTQTVGLLGASASLTVAGANRSVCVDFLVDDVDALLPRLRDLVEALGEPVDLPWGNRSVLFRDPDGNLVNFFTPSTPEARERFGLSPSGN